MAPGRQRMRPKLRRLQTARSEWWLRGRGFVFFGANARSAAGETGEQTDWRLKTRLDDAGHDVGEVAVDADLGEQQTVDQALIAVDVGCHDLEQVVDAAAGGVALDHLVDLADRGLETLKILIAVLLEHDLDQDGRDGAELLEVDLGMVAADQAGFFQALEALPARRRREIDRAGECCLGDPPLRLQRGQDLQIDRIEPGHRAQVFQTRGAGRTTRPAPCDHRRNEMWRQLAAISCSAARFVVCPSLFGRA